jgi:uncharacterized membrane protein
MRTRFALLDLIARSNLDAATASRVWQLAGFDRPPPALLGWMRLGLGIVGAGCAGLGVMFWVAANWGVLGRFQQFALLQSLVALLCIGTAVWRKARVPLALLTLLATGGLLAYFGQTYQSGGDPWQLFALWAGLTLPLAWGVRADSVWAAWIVVALTALTLWDGEHTRRAWDFDVGDGAVHVIAALCAAFLTASMSAPCRRHTGAGTWAFGMALVLSAVFVTTTAVRDLWDASSPHYGFSLVLLGLAALLIAHARPFDVFAASVVGLALNVLLVARTLLMFKDTREFIFPLLVVGIVALGLLAITVTLIMAGVRQSAAKGEPA